MKFFLPNPPGPPKIKKRSKNGLNTVNNPKIGLLLGAGKHYKGFEVVMSDIKVLAATLASTN